MVTVIADLKVAAADTLAAAGAEGDVEPQNPGTT